MNNSSTWVQERLKAFLEDIALDDTYHGFEKQLLSRVDFVSVSVEQQETEFALRVQEFMCNKDGFLHGGAATTLLDNLSSTALTFVQRDGFWPNFGVTRTITMFFHRPIPCGEHITVRCSLVAAGKKMATVHAAMYDSGQTRCVTCLHDKFAIPVSRL